MISAVNGVSFRGNDVQDLINSPGQYAVAKTSELPADSFEKKSKAPLAAGITALAALAAFAGLGYAVHNHHLEKIGKEMMPEKFFEKSWAYIKNTGHMVGEFAEKCYKTVAGWFGKEVKLASEIEKIADDAADAVL